MDGDLVVSRRKIERDREENLKYLIVLLNFQGGQTQALPPMSSFRGANTPTGAGGVPQPPNNGGVGGPGTPYNSQIILPSLSHTHSQHSPAIQSDGSVVIGKTLQTVSRANQSSLC